MGGIVMAPNFGLHHRSKKKILMATRQIETMILRTETFVPSIQLQLL